MAEYFKRTEKKYIIPPDKYPALLSALKEHMHEDSYGLQPIYNIYFDDTGDRFIRLSMQSPVFKEKMRLRSYGPARKGGYIYAELKKKYKGVVYKRRIKLDAGAAAMLLAGATVQDCAPNGQAAQELDHFITNYKVGPKIFIAYDRLALHCPADRYLRVTFDSNIAYRQSGLELSMEHPVKIYDDSLIIMEIKTPLAMPLWLTRLLSDMDIRPRPFSKYGRIFTQISQGV